MIRSVQLAAYAPIREHIFWYLPSGGEDLAPELVADARDFGPPDHTESVLKVINECGRPQSRTSFPDMHLELGQREKRLAGQTKAARFKRLNLASNV